MPAIVFPSSPSHEDEFVANGRTWIYDSTIPAWRPKADAAVPLDLGNTYVAHSVVQGLSDAAKRRAQSNIGLPKLNLTATVPPVAANDTTQGYSVLSLWADVTNDLAYVCLDATATAAVWLPIGITAEQIENLVDLSAAFADITTTGETPGEIVRIKSPGGLETITVAELRDLVMPFKTRTETQGNPNGTAATLTGTQAVGALVASGATNPLVNGLWTQVGTLNGKPDYRVDAAIAGTNYGDMPLSPLPVSSWPRLSWSGGKWQFYGPDFQPIYSVVSASGSPNGLVFAVDVAGSGTPPTVGSFIDAFPFSVDPPTTADFVGQLCRVGDTPNGPFEWWRWDSVSWRPETADLSALTTSGFSEGSYPRAKVGGGLEPRNPAQVRDDVVPVRLNRGRILFDPSGMTTDGLNATAFTGELHYAGDFDGHMSFTGDGTPHPSLTSSVGLFWSGSHWTLFDGPFEWWSDSDVPDPVDAVGWYNPVDSTGSPVFTADYDGDYLNQFARTGAAPDYKWYHWDGAKWNAVGGAGSNPVYYFTNASANGQWGHLPNWSLDAAGTIPAPNLPPPGAAVMVNSIITDLGGEVTVNSATFMPSGALNDTNPANSLTVETEAVFQSAAEVTGGKLIGRAMFVGQNAVVGTNGIVDGDAFFFDITSGNLGTILGSGYFRDLANDYGTVVGGAKLIGSYFAGLPVSMVANNYLRVAVGGYGFEQRTPAQVKSDIGALGASEVVRYDLAQTPLTANQRRTFESNQGVFAPNSMSPISAATWTPSMANSQFQKASVTVGSFTLQAPTGGSTEGNQLTLWLTAPSGGCLFNVNTGQITLPSDTGLALPKTFESNKLYIVQLRYTNKWILTSIVGGY